MDANDAASAYSSTAITSARDFEELHQHSWFYYLSEISLFRLSNRVNHAFYSSRPLSWTSMNLLDMMNAA